MTLILALAGLPVFLYFIALHAVSSKEEVCGSSFPVGLSHHEIRVVEPWNLRWKSVSEGKRWRRSCCSGFARSHILKRLHHPIYDFAIPSQSGLHFLPFFCPSLPLVSSVWELEGWANCQPQTWHRDSSPPINALFPSLSSSRQALSKVFCQSTAAKAEPRLDIAGVSWRSGSKKQKKDTGTEHLERWLLRDRESKGESVTAKKKSWDRMWWCGAGGGGGTLRRCIKVRRTHLCDKRWEAGQWWKETMLVNKAEQMSRWWWMSDSEKTGPAWAAAPALSERANASRATSTLIIHQPR